jgi:hypothetical protein
MNTFITTLLLTFSTTLAFADLSQNISKTEKIDSITYNCINQIRHQLIKEFALNLTSESDHNDLQDHKEFIRTSPAYACRHRNNPNIEDISWCDGTGCVGATAKFKNGVCAVSSWSGQDDQDEVDLKDYAESCLVKS